jgi:hypothetical protein
VSSVGPHGGLHCISMDFTHTHTHAYTHTEKFMGTHGKEKEFPWVLLQSNLESNKPPGDKFLVEMAKVYLQLGLEFIAAVVWLALGVASGYVSG